MGTSTVVSKLPECSFCKAQAQYDGATTMGPWGYMCQIHFGMYGVGLGTGRGQKLTVAAVSVVANPVTFEQWMRDVNRKLLGVCGLSFEDIGDVVDMAGMYESGVSVDGAAEAALDEAGWDGER